MNEIRALTGIRGIAALTVFLAHTREALVPRGVQLPVSPLGERLFLSGGRQVDIFFVLSGFILTLIYVSWFDHGLSRDSYFRFLRKRFARIYPLQAFMLSLVAGFVLAAYLSHAEVFNGLSRFSFSTLAQNYLLIHAWGFAGKDGGPWNPPSWSISIEALAYLLFPFFLWGTAAARKSYPWLLLLASIASGFLCNAVMFWGEIGLSGISRGLTEFALGSVVASFYDGGLADRLRSNIGSAVALAGLIVCFALTPDTGFVIAVFAAPLLLALSGRNYVSAFFGSTPVYFLGEISYSVYLGHFLFTSIAYRLVSVEWMRSSWVATIIGVAFIIAFVVGLSTLTYFAIERPGRDWLGGRRKQAPAAALVQTN
jgi:peptidoglycan/LPS O-acetylase OafA/YrhL